MLHVRIPDTINIERELSIAARVNKNAFFVFYISQLSFLGARQVIQQPTLRWMLTRKKGIEILSTSLKHHVMFTFFCL